MASTKSTTRSAATTTTYTDPRIANMQTSKHNATQLNTQTIMEHTQAIQPTKEHTIQSKTLNKFDTTTPIAMQLTASPATVNHYTAPLHPPRFPRNPCPSAHHTLSLIQSQADAERLFGKSFNLRSPTTGELLGPFALLAYTDGWISAYCAYIHRVMSTSVFSLREREVIVLAVAGVTRAEYVVYAHRRIAAGVGLEGPVVEGVLDGWAWTDMLDLSAREKSVYRVAVEMAQGWGRVSDETWRDVVATDKPKARGQEGWLNGESEGWEDVEVDGEAVEMDEGRLTRTEIATLAQVVASSMYVSVLVNCADVEVPQAASQP